MARGNREGGAESVERGAWSVERGAWSVEREAWSVERGAKKRGKNTNEFNTSLRRVILKAHSVCYRLRGLAPG